MQVDFYFFRNALEKTIWNEQSLFITKIYNLFGIFDI